MKIPKINNYPC